MKPHSTHDPDHRFPLAVRGGRDPRRLALRNLQQHTTMKIALAICLGVNACIGLLIWVFQHQLLQ